MDENLGYSGEDGEERRTSSQWNLTHESLLSFERESSNQFLQYRNFHLHLIKKKEVPSERRIIPSTKNERLSYFRNYVSSPIKTQACLRQKSFNLVFWEYVLNTIFKSLQHTYASIFLASYVPEEHLFVAKMVPFMYGLKYCFIITGFLEVIAYVSNTVFIFDYLIGSIFLKNPWNRCPENGFVYVSNDHNGNATTKVYCYNIIDFGKRVRNKTVEFQRGFYYIPEDDENLQIVQIEYFIHKIIKDISFPLLILYNIVIWGILACCYNQLFNKNFWRVYHKVHWGAIAMDLITYSYLLLYYYDKDYFEAPSIEVTPHLYERAFEDANVDFLAESTTAPPLVHVLTARSTQEILPGHDSAILVISNGLCYIFRAMLSYKIKQYCESLARVPILIPGFIGPNSWLYFWPMFLSTFFLGDIFTLIFLSLHFVMEIMTTVVTFQCLVEVVVVEWPPLPASLVCSAMIIVGCFFNIFVPLDLFFVLTYNKSTATMLECVVLYWMYPVYRLADDMSFHCGSPLHFVRVQLLVMCPIYYMFKYLGILESISILIVSLKITGKWYMVQGMMLAFFFIIVPLLIGIICSIYVYVWKGRRKWSQMFAPAEDWGPRDYNTRQLRKEFDSRTYNNSQAPRNLCRYIISRAETKAYRLDIRYDTNRQSAGVNDLRTENENNLQNSSTSKEQ